MARPRHGWRGGAQRCLKQWEIDRRGADMFFAAQRYQWRAAAHVRAAEHRGRAMGVVARHLAYHEGRKVLTPRERFPYIEHFGNRLPAAALLATAEPTADAAEAAEESAAEDARWDFIVSKRLVEYYREVRPTLEAAALAAARPPEWAHELGIREVGHWSLRDLIWAYKLAQRAHTAAGGMVLESD